MCWLPQGVERSAEIPPECAHRAAAGRANAKTQMEFPIESVDFGKSTDFSLRPTNVFDRRIRFGDGALGVVDQQLCVAPGAYQIA